VTSCSGGKSGCRVVRRISPFGKCSMCPIAREANSCQSWVPESSPLGLAVPVSVTICLKSPTVVQVLNDMQAIASTTVVSITTLILSIYAQAWYGSPIVAAQPM
jgi:hypothetical protein